MISTTTLILVPFAALVGWVFHPRRWLLRRKTAPKKYPPDYLVGLNFLLNEQPDKAVDVFIRLLEVDSDTVETHLALGALFRRRGEVDRAIRIHQNLIARPQLEKRLKSQALLALGRDYMVAGVLDRSERLMQEVVELGGDCARAGFRYLVSIYEQEKAWHDAIATARQLQQQSGESLAHNISHYLCELAALSLDAGFPDEANKLLRQAHVTDPKNVRVNLIRGQLCQQQGDYRGAIKYLKQISEQDPEFIPESLETLTLCYEALGRTQAWLEYLEQSVAKYPQLALFTHLGKMLQKYQGREAGVNFFSDKLLTYPSVAGLHTLITLQQTGDAAAPALLHTINHVTTQLVEHAAHYRCRACGFSGKTLHWNCPGCHQWGVVKPICGRLCTPPEVSH